MSKAALPMQQLLDAVRKPRQRLDLALRMETAVARSAQVALSRCKKAWKADGHTEAAIHEVIPDRPVAVHV
ncbi:MAG: hypothetical protein EXR77_14280 [Myxococcales bacterium]|nr:hypothetical protein [Myxococcales bacterium]